MIHGPLEAVNDCFLTDQRSFSTDTAVTARLTSSVTVVLEGQTVSLVDESHAASPTVEVDCEDGDVEGVQSADSSRMRFFDPSNQGDQQVSVQVLKNGLIRENIHLSAPYLESTG